MVNQTENTVVLHFPFEVDYELSTGRYQEKGRDLWVLQSQPGGGWLAVWRTQFFGV